jgi:HSP20 family protein
MTLVRFNPKRAFAGAANDFDSVFNSFFNAPVSSDSCNCDFMPRVDIVEDKDSLFLQFELPGMKKEEIKVVVEDGTLTVSGERKQETKDEGTNYVRTERSYGAFTRSFTLPDNVDNEKISADYKDGLLHVVMQKTEQAKPKEIAVEVK